jgi:hypothetical protein
MNKLAIVLSISAAALLGNLSAVNAAGDKVKANTSPEVTQQSTDISSRNRQYRHYGYRGYNRGYRNSYGYYRPGSYYGGGYGGRYGGSYYGGGYGYGGPSISFGFGGDRGW